MLHKDNEQNNVAIGRQNLKKKIQINMYIREEKT